ncbi:MAG: DNA polymerase III subunit delta [Methylococcaceae bacterium]|nr:DNA polymerase III subunit delta [Methylococcaceae bacterium]
MRLKPEQLETSLKKMAAVYLISGDEALQSGEAADAIRKAAKNAGYITREVLSVETGFEWNELSVAANSMSIFADKKLIDLRLITGKPGTEGAKALSNYCQHLPEDTLLLITSPKLAGATLKTKWFQSIEQAGVVVQTWPLEGADLIQWLQRRAKKRGLLIELDGIKVLASRIEGNLLAAAQEIEKLYILHGESTLSKQAVEQAVADSARFDVFKLTDCVLSGRVSRAIKIVNGLKSEGIAAPVVLWALAREARLLIKIKTALKQGQNKEIVFKNHRLWDKRKQLVNATLSRIDIKALEQVLLLGYKADQQIKGQEKGDCWETLISVCLLFSAV